MHSNTLAVILVASFCCDRAAFAQGFIYDQQAQRSDTLLTGEHPVIQQSQPIGQSFVPGLAEVGFVRLHLIDAQPSNSLGAVLSVAIRGGGLDGPLLGTSDPVPLSDSFNGLANFHFWQPVQVSPGQTYFIVPQVVSGDLWSVLYYHFGYTAGAGYISGTANPTGWDLWFREGVVVPEPSTLALLFIGTPVLAWAVRRREWDPFPNKLASGGATGSVVILPPERRSPNRQVLSFSRKRAGTEIGVPQSSSIVAGRGQRADAPSNRTRKNRSSAHPNHPPPGRRWQGRRNGLFALTPKATPFRFLFQAGKAKGPEDNERGIVSRRRVRSSIQPGTSRRDGSVA